MVKRLSMDSQDKRMFMVESGVSGTTIDYNNHRVSDEDCFGDILNMFDLPMENLEGDCLAEDWASKLGPIPSEIGVANNLGYSMDLPFECHMPIYKTYQQQYHQNHGEETSQNINISQLKQHPPYDENNKLYPSQSSFQAPSPNSVLENRTSTSNNKGVSFGIEISIPVRTRTKRLKPTANPWLMSPLLLLPNKDKKRKKTTKNHEKSELVGIKKCSHCEITKTPQWREGPMGPKTLCNACGVRYRSGRLYPEYRPAASPTFVPSLHSNSHRKVIEMRQKVVK